MRYFLPKREKRIINSSLRVIWSFATNIMALTCLLLIIALSSPNIQQTISPLVASMSSFAHNTIFPPQESIESLHSSFSFAPGSVQRKFDSIDLNGLNILSFYDVTVNGDGTLNTDSDGYQSLYSDSANSLFQRARQNDTKILLTLTQISNNDLLALLDNDQAQQSLYNQTAQEVANSGIDGVTVDFEYSQAVDNGYRNRFTNFVKGFTNYMHQNAPNSIVSVAIADNIKENSLYDVKELGTSSDKTMVMANSFAVPEAMNGNIISPVHGFNSSDYLKIVNNTMNKFLVSVPKEKLVVERAWYGNGNNYPIYNTDNLPADNEPSKNTLETPLSKAVINRLVGDIQGSAKESARRNLPYIAQALEKEGILNSNVLAYALATIQHETADTFEPIDEYTGRKSARRLGYEGGTDYYGRGFIQLTHLQNYQKMGARIGLKDELAKHPELASRPDIAAKILAAYFKDFGIAKLATEGNFYDARSLINPDYNAETIAEIAMNFAYALV